MNIRQNSIEDYDQIMEDVAAKIEANPDHRFRIILQALKSVDCPYLRRKLRKEFDI